MKETLYPAVVLLWLVVGIGARVHIQPFYCLIAVVVVALGTKSAE